VEIFFALVKEIGVFLVHGAVGHHGGDFLYDFGSFFKGEQVGHLSIVEDVTDVFHHGFIDDLGVGKQENALFVLQTSCFHEPLKLFDPVLLVHLHKFVVCDVAA
jgi:hypothetical protein